MFVDADNYPVLVHCIHGKDRTGLIVMLIMLLCSVEPEVRSYCPAAVPWVLARLSAHARQHAQVLIHSRGCLADPARQGNLTAQLGEGLA